MDRQTAEVVVVLVAAGIGFVVVLGVSRGFIEAEDATWAFLGLGLLFGYPLLAIAGGAVAQLPQISEIHTRDDILGIIAIFPWATIDARLGEGFTFRCVLFGVVVGIAYEGWRRWVSQKA